MGFSIFPAKKNPFHKIQVSHRHATACMPAISVPCTPIARLTRAHIDARSLRVERCTAATLLTCPSFQFEQKILGATKPLGGDAITSNDTPTKEEAAAAQAAIDETCKALVSSALAKVVDTTASEAIEADQAAKAEAERKEKARLEAEARAREEVAAYAAKAEADKAAEEAEKAAAPVEVEAPRKLTETLTETLTEAPRKLSSAVVGWVSGLFEALTGYAQPLLYLLQVPIAADMMGALVPWRGREEEKTPDVVVHVPSAPEQQRRPSIDEQMQAAVKAEEEAAAAAKLQAIKRGQAARKEVEAKKDMASDAEIAEACASVISSAMAAVVAAAGVEESPVKEGPLKRFSSLFGSGKKSKRASNAGAAEAA